MELIRDRYKLGLVLAALFFAGIAISIYVVYNLPYHLSPSGEVPPAFINVYLALGVTFLLGALAIWLGLSHKNEVIVYRDKQQEREGTDQNGTDQAHHGTTISLETVKAGINAAKDGKEVLQAGLQAICKQLEAGQGAAYRVEEEEGTRKILLRGGYALSIGENAVISYSLGEGLIGQCAATGKTLYIDDVPEGYIKIISGLGSASPRYLLIVPALSQGAVTGVVEIASFTPLSEDQRKFAEESVNLIYEKLTGFQP